MYHPLISKNARILLANLFQSSRSTFSCVSFPSVFAFQDDMWDTHISARGFANSIPRQIRRIRDPGGGHVHEVFQTPVLFGIPKVKLDLEPQPIIVHEWRVRQGQV